MVASFAHHYQVVAGLFLGRKMACVAALGTRSSSGRETLPFPIQRPEHKSRQPSKQGRRPNPGWPFKHEFACKL